MGYYTEAIAIQTFYRLPKEKNVFKLDALFPFQIDHFLPDVVCTILFI
jgi:hypothetical protein